MKLVYFVLYFTIIGLFLSGCTRNHSQNTLCVYPQIPLPQSAHSIVQGVDALGVSVMMFETDDSQENILLFYKPFLLQNEWKIAIDDVEGKDVVYNRSGDPSDNTCTIDILTSKTSNGLTRVIINQGDRAQ